MRKDQFDKLIEYIDAAIAHSIAHTNPYCESSYEYLAKSSARQELHDSFFKAQEEAEENIGKNYIIKSLKDQNEIALGLMEETSDILCKMPGESLPDAAHRIMKKYNEHDLFFNKLLDPDELRWSATEEVRNEARLFLGIPQVIIKKK